MSDYKPVDCAFYSRFELAILRRQRLLVSWHDTDGVSHLETLVPRDLKTREGAEYLLAETLAGGRLRLRLDRIQSARPTSR